MKVQGVDLCKMFAVYCTNDILITLDAEQQGVCQDRAKAWTISNQFVPSAARMHLITRTYPVGHGWSAQSVATSWMRWSLSTKLHGMTVGSGVIQGCMWQQMMMADVLVSNPWVSAQLPVACAADVWVLLLVDQLRQTSSA